MKKGKIQQQIYKLLLQKSCTTQEMEKKLKLTEFQIKESLKSLIDNGCVEKDNDINWEGKWKLTGVCKDE